MAVIVLLELQMPSAHSTPSKPPIVGNETALKIAIIQSAYIPWKGFFDLIGRCDEYVIFDSVQFVKRHWHNRNRVKTANGPVWLTIPVATKSRYAQPISEVEVEGFWVGKHWRTLELAYRRAPCFDSVAPLVRQWYDAAEKETHLTQINRIFLKGIAGYLGLKTRFVPDTAYPAHGTKTERLLSIAKAAGADCYLSGPSARPYLQEDRFAAEGIVVEWMNYDHYPEYAQLHGAFEHQVSILNLLFHLGDEAVCYCRQSSASRAPGPA